ncbi:hypothetical protein G7Z17_g2507 [Cylindrodendrum hubeiense]|uniref:Cytochrome P450 n=1 Tax=Cylindrodendrum hubeiense TaxID=595255 RepID=A0A9P5LED7_9HYPO|nr:hypothetical protein G7Z17_g2507 [Cylindrodendrum hubeiense]
MISYAAIAILLAYGVYRLLQVGKREPGLPPGPPTVPIFGNMLQLAPRETEWQLTEWHKTYGPIFSLKLGGDTLIVIKDREAIRDLWEKKALIYSDRAESYVASLLTKNHHAAFQSMGPAWRDRRKLISHHYSPQQCDTIHAEYQNAEVLALIKTLIDDPEDFYQLLKRYAAAVTGSLTYGKRPKTFDDSLCQDVVAAMGYIAENMEVGATPPVDQWPFTVLRWMPGQFAFWKRRAMEHGKRMDALFSKLWNEFLERRTAGRMNGCLFDKFLNEAGSKGGESLGSWQWGLHSLQFLGGEILEGGADTTSSTLISFVMAMACYPEAQAKCQAQIDAAIGSDRTPGWALHMDEEYYPEPEKFLPDRCTTFRYEGRTKLADHYQGNAEWQHRDHYGYGGGRRICPGMHLAERNLWRAISKILWAFEITPIVDPLTGVPKPPSTTAFSVNGEESAFFGGAVRVAHPFDVNIKPRSPKHVAVLLKEYEAAQSILKKYD